MLESTGSRGRGVERRVPEMRRMFEFNCNTQLRARSDHYELPQLTFGIYKKLKIVQNCTIE